jgi:hypothetical protein
MVLSRTIAAVASGRHIDAKFMAFVKIQAPSFLQNKRRS